MPMDTFERRAVVGGFVAVMVLSLVAAVILTVYGIDVPNVLTVLGTAALVSLRTMWAGGRFTNGTTYSNGTNPPGTSPGGSQPERAR